MTRYISIIGGLMLLLLGGCGEYSKVLKSRDADYKFDYAKRAYEQCAAAYD